MPYLNPRYAQPSRVGSDNLILSDEPDICGKCGLQFEDGDTILFDKSQFTFIIGPTVDRKYVNHPGVMHEHVKPTCKEVKKIWKKK